MGCTLVNSKHICEVREDLLPYRDEYLVSVSEREISDFHLAGVVAQSLISSSEQGEAEKPFVSDGLMEIHDDYARMICLSKGEGAVYQLRVNLKKPCRGNGFSIRYRLSNWKKISYLAIGNTEGREFRHVKIANPVDGEWVTLTLGLNDLAFRMQQDWKAFDVGDFYDLRLFIKGEPEGQSQLDLQWLSVWVEVAEQYPIEVQGGEIDKDEKLTEALVAYFEKCNPDIQSHAEIFLRQGRLPLTGRTVLEWGADKETPEELQTSGTFRYLWHAMQPAITLLVYHVRTNDMSALMAGRQLIADWLERSFFKPDSDKKYTWYDHGSAERLLAFLLLLCLGKKYNFDKRYMARLSIACFDHARLLESEVFYAAHQKTRYHNHAWFQDMALIASAAVFSKLPCASRWLNVGENRLRDQFSKLIVRDQGYAIFVENSIGYHHGIQRLVAFAGKLISIAGIDGDIPKIAHELDSWSSYFRYPDGRAPAQGDTFRIANESRRANGSFDKGVLVLPVAGYAVAKGLHDAEPYFLCMFATSLCSTHKHQDNLSVVLHFDGVEWLIDPSMYSHEYGEKIPAFLRSAKAHNCFSIENFDYSLEPGLASISGSEDGARFVFSGSHSAYPVGDVRRLVTGALDRFSIEVLDSGSFSINLEPYIVWHLGEGVVVCKGPKGLILSHPMSSWSLRLVTDETIQIVGLGEEHDGFIGVAGTSFMSKTNTVLLYVKLKLGAEHSFKWSLEAIRNDCVI